MVAVNEILPNQRRHVLFEGTWPEQLELIAANRCETIQVGPEERDAMITFFGNRLSGTQKRQLASYLISLSPDTFYDWIESVIVRMLETELDREWLKATEIAQYLEHECGLMILAIFNFGCHDTSYSRDIPRGAPYPLAFVLTPHNSGQLEG